MQRRALIRYLTRHACVLLREGGKHSVYYQPTTHRTSTVPRHVEISDVLARKICLDLGIPPP